jgi:hypothetical protein
MSDKYRFFHRARVRAPVPVCWDVFTDYERFTEFTNTPVKLIREGYTERNGLGAIRRNFNFAFDVDEITNIWRPNEVYGYHIIESKVIEAHQGIVRFYPTNEGGCEWVYDMQNIPGPIGLKHAEDAGVSYHNFLGEGFKFLMACLESECERRADQERTPVRPPSTQDEAIFR